MGARLENNFNFKMPGGKRIKIGDDEFEILNDIFTNQREFGPFVKGSDPNDLKLALMMMSKGTEGGSTKLKKEHLFNIIKALLMHQKLAEKVEIEDDQSNSNQSEINEVTDEDVIENEDKQSPPEDKDTTKKPTNVKKEKENDSKDLKDKVCYFFRTKSCQHGRSGNIPDKSGNKCSYNHPSSVCKKFENYGDTDRGCQDNQCKKMHVVHCRHFMLGKCNLDKKCKFFHQKNLQKKPQEKKKNQQRGTKSNEKSSENKNKIQRVPKSENIDFLCQTNPHQMACGNCRTNSHLCPQQKQVHQFNQKQDQIQNNPNQLKDMLSMMIKLIHQNL
jgi:hypothetical protein